MLGTPKRLCFCKRDPTSTSGFPGTQEIGNEKVIEHSKYVLQNQSIKVA